MHQNGLMSVCVIFLSYLDQATCDGNGGGFTIKEVPTGSEEKAFSATLEVDR